ncbi:hypothetical protein COCNU_14G000590 [Cocos nucifera]|uniref:Uncharacterized protein n=1 Tax=Cocos nucifera TaxID=13894 RepID=A0A8K0ITU5_COCNU|nr:hypothetical protein COCNU_14G000590 [Cocos nucifera]
MRIARPRRVQTSEYRACVGGMDEAKGEDAGETPSPLSTPLLHPDALTKMADGHLFKQHPPRRPRRNSNPFLVLFSRCSPPESLLIASSLSSRLAFGHLVVLSGFLYILFPSSWIQEVEENEIMIPFF